MREIDPIDENGAGGELNKAKERRGDRRLARAGAADDARVRTRGASV